MAVSDGLDRKHKHNGMYAMKYKINKHKMQ